MKPILISICLWLLSSGALSNEFPGGREALEDGLVAWVSEATKRPPQDISTGQLNRNIEVKPCRSALIYSFPFANENTVQAQCEGQWKLFLQIQYSDSIANYIASRDITVGSKITKTDIKNQSKPEDTHPWINLFALRDISIGEAVTANDFSEGFFLLRVTEDIPAGQLVNPSMIERFSGTLSGDQGTAIVDFTARQLVARVDLNSGTILSDQNVETRVPMVIAVRGLPFGKILEDEDVEIKWVKKEGQTKRLITDLQAVIGLQTTRQIRPLQPIRYSDVTQAVLIRKGDSVKLIIERGQIRIEIDAIALEDGQFGEQIELTNPDSGQTIRGVVVGKSRAKGIR